MLQSPTMKAVTSSTSLQIPGDGKGSSLTIVDVLDITAADDTRTVTVDAIVGLATGQLLISHDGFWGTLVEFPTGADEGTFATDLTANTLTQTAHGLVDTNTVVLYDVGPGIPAPLVAGKVYFVVTGGANDFQLALTSGGAAIDITGANRNVGVRQVTANQVRVDRWRKAGDSPNEKAVPALGTNVLRVFPAGSVLAGASGVVICGINIISAITAAATFDIHDYGASALHQIASVVGQLGTFDQYEWKLSSPFMYLVSNTTNLRVEILFKLT